MSDKKMVILKVDAEFLARILQLPAEAEVVDVHLVPMIRGQIMFRVEGMGRPVQEGRMIPQLIGEIDATNEGRITWREV